MPRKKAATVRLKAPAPKVRRGWGKVKPATQVIEPKKERERRAAVKAKLKKDKAGEE